MGQLLLMLNEEVLSDGVGSTCTECELEARYNGPNGNIQFGWVKPQSTLSSNLALRVDTSCLFEAIRARPAYKTLPRRLYWARTDFWLRPRAGGGDLH